MSLHSFERSKVLSTQDEPFSAYLMEALRKADTHHAAALAV